MENPGKSYLTLYLIMLAQEWCLYSSLPEILRKKLMNLVTGKSPAFHWHELCLSLCRHGVVGTHHDTSWYMAFTPHECRVSFSFVLISDCYLTVPPVIQLIHIKHIWWHSLLHPMGNGTGATPKGVELLSNGVENFTEPCEPGEEGRKD